MDQITQSTRTTSQDDARPKIFVNSLPKSGTHLLTSILDNISGLKYQKPALNRNLRWRPIDYVRLWDQRTCLVGIGRPRKVKLATLYHILNGLHPGRYLIGHVPYQECVHDSLNSFGIRTLFVTRDPRDVVVSQVHYVLKRKFHHLHKDFKRLRTDKERIITAILGIRKSNSVKSRGIAEKLTSTLKWADQESVMVLHFEELIGERGGGSLESQEKAIMNIGKHIGIEIGVEEAHSIGESAFGKGHTYRKGKIGGWQDVFDKDVKDIFKRAAGEHLVNMGYEGDQNW